MRIDAIVAALNGREWPQHVTERLGPNVGDAIRPNLRTVIGSVPVDEPATARLGCTKLGGLPHVDDSFEWPTEEGTDEPLALVCQVNLDEASAASDGALKSTGLLYLFSIFDSDRAYGGEIDDATATLIHVAAPGPLSVAEPPDGISDEDDDEGGRFTERVLSLRPALVCRDEAGTSVRYDYAVERAIDEVAVELGGGVANPIRLLDEPTADDSPTGDHERIGGEVPLLYINGYSTAKHAFGEGDFFISITSDDLSAGRLDRASVWFESGT